MLDDPRFELELPLFKADDGDDWRFEGVASTSAVDREGERITEKAIASFKEQFAGVPVCLAGSHGEATINVLSEVGAVDKTFGDNTTFGIGGAWDKAHPSAAWVVGKLGNKAQPPRWKLSIGGSIPQDGRRAGFVSGSGRVVEIDEMRLNHVLLCRAESAVNQDTSIAASPVGKAGEDVDMWAPVFKAAASLENDDGNTDKPEDLPRSDADCASAEKAVSERPWSQVDDRGALPDSAYLYVIESDGGKVREFPVYEGSAAGGQGPLNRDAVAEAVGKVGSTSQEVQAVVVPQLCEIHRQHGWPLPTSLTEGKAEVPEDNMDPDAKRSLAGRIANTVTAFLSGEPDEAADGAGVDGDAAAKADAPGGGVEVKPEEIQEMVAKSVADAMTALETKLGATMTAAIEKALATEEPVVEETPVADEPTADAASATDETPPAPDAEVEDPPAEDTPAVDETPEAGKTETPPAAVDVEGIVAKVVEQVGAPLQAKIAEISGTIATLATELNATPETPETEAAKAGVTEKTDGAFPFVQVMSQIPGVRDKMEDACRAAGVDVLTGEQLPGDKPLWG